MFLSLEKLHFLSLFQCSNILRGWYGHTSWRSCSFSTTDVRGSGYFWEECRLSNVSVGPVKADFALFRGYTIEVHWWVWRLEMVMKLTLMSVFLFPPWSRTRTTRRTGTGSAHCRGNNARPTCCGCSQIRTRKPFWMAWWTSTLDQQLPDKDWTENCVLNVPVVVVGVVHCETCTLSTRAIGKERDFQKNGREQIEFPFFEIPFYPQVKSFLKRALCVHV